MKKEVRKAFVAGIVNGVVFTFAFLIFLVEMCDNPNTEEDLHPEENLAVDTIISDLSMFAKEDVEKEYLKRQSPEHILDVLLHRYSMVGTIWEEKWNHLSDLEKVKILLDSLKKEDTSEKESEDNVYQSQAELNQIHGQWSLEYNDSIEKEFQKLITMMSEYRNELNREAYVWKKYQKAVREVADCEDHGSSTPMFVDDVLNQGISLREVSFSKLILHLKGKGVLFSKTIFTSSMITDAYSVFIEAVGENEYNEYKTQYQEALRNEQKCWNEWMYYRALLSQNLPSDIKRYYDNCTNMVKRTKLLQLKNQNQALGVCGHEVIDCVLPDNCSDKALLNYPGFDKVWAKHCENTDWYPKFE